MGVHGDLMVSDGKYKECFYCDYMFVFLFTSPKSAEISKPQTYQKFIFSQLHQSVNAISQTF